MKKRNLLILSLLVLTTSCENDIDPTQIASSVEGISSPSTSGILPSNSDTSITISSTPTTTNTPSTSIIPSTTTPSTSTSIIPSTTTPSTSTKPPVTSVVTPSTSKPSPSSDKEPDENGLVIDPIAGNYYSKINFSKSPKEIKTSLKNLISDHTVISYGGLYDAYKETDLLPGTTNTVYDMYSNVKYQHTKSNQCGNYSKEGDCYNREHSIPQSWFGEKSPMKTDLFHVYPTDGKVNGMRSNYPFGEVKVASYTSLNGSKRGSAVTFGGTTPSMVFEPVDEFKGDFARTYFYFATRYEGSNITSSGGNVVFTANAVYPGLTNYSIQLFLKWNEEDPISEKETTRNQIIFKNWQHNRNPFIDIKGLPELLWGSLRS